MKKLLFLGLLVGVVFFLITASGDVRSIIGWALTAYLVIRALPGVKNDCRWLGQLVSSRRRLSLRRSKVDTL